MSDAQLPPPQVDLGETVTLRARVEDAIEGDRVRFRITTQDGQPVTVLSAPVEGGVARAEWVVDLGRSAPPVDLVFEAECLGDVASSSVLRVGALRLEATSGWLIDPDPEDTQDLDGDISSEDTDEPVVQDDLVFLGGEDVPVDTVLVLRSELGASRSPVRGQIQASYRLEREDPVGSGTFVEFETFVGSFISSQGIRAVVLRWKAKAPDVELPARVRSVFTWQKGELEGGQAISPELVVHPPVGESDGMGVIFAALRSNSGRVPLAEVDYRFTHPEFEEAGTTDAEGVLFAGPLPQGDYPLSVTFAGQELELVLPTGPTNVGARPTRVLGALVEEEQEEGEDVEQGPPDPFDVALGEIDPDAPLLEDWEIELEAEEGRTALDALRLVSEALGYDETVTTEQAAVGSEPGVLSYVFPEGDDGTYQLFARIGERELRISSALEIVDGTAVTQEEELEDDSEFEPEASITLAFCCPEDEDAA